MPPLGRAMRGTEKVSWTVLAGAGSVALYQIAELLKNHSSWSEVFTPAHVSEHLVVVAGLLGAVGAATMITKSRGARKRADAVDRVMAERYRTPPGPPAA